MMATRFEFRPRLRAHFRPSASCRVAGPADCAGLMPSGWVSEGSTWLVIGERPSGERLVLDVAPTPERAQALVGRYREHLEGYAQIVAEPQDKEAW